MPLDHADRVAVVRPVRVRGVDKLILCLNAGLLPGIMPPMRKIILLTIVGIIILSPAWADAVDNTAVVNAALDQATRQGAAPVWKASLGEIENSVAVFVEANKNLNEEARALEAQQSRLEEAINTQRQTNAEQAAALAARREELDAPAASGAGKQRLAQMEKNTTAAGNAVTAAQARLKAVDSKLALRRLKIEGLELEKKIGLNGLRHADGFNAGASQVRGQVS